MNKIVNADMVNVDLNEGLQKLDQLISQLQLGRGDHIFFFALLQKLQEKINPPTPTNLV